MNTKAFAILSFLFICFTVNAQVTLDSQKGVFADFYGDNIVRIFAAPAGGSFRFPEAVSQTGILVPDARKETEVSGGEGAAFTRSLAVTLEEGLLVVRDLRSGREVLHQTYPVKFSSGKTEIRFSAQPYDYFYGGGPHSGRFSHKGTTLAIRNQGGGDSCVPFFWSTSGYGILWNTSSQGSYTFDKHEVVLTHDTDCLDLFILVDETPVLLLADYYQLTGKPVLPPKAAFYEGDKPVRSERISPVKGAGTKGSVCDQIPSCIGAGLSGQPFDLEGIFWNGKYLKLKSELMPYTYSVAREAVDGLPMVRAMLLEGASHYTMGTSTSCQFLLGPSLLVAPLYEETAPDADGGDIRNNIFLPEDEWLDYETDECYGGGYILNSFAVTRDRLPVFVRRGAILPMAAPHNRLSERDCSRRIYAVYPYRESSFTEYDDDGVSMAYLEGQCATTLVESKQDKGKVVITIHPAEGSFKGMVKEKVTEVRIHTGRSPQRLAAWVDGRSISAETAFENGVATILIPSMDITKSVIRIEMDGFAPPKRMIQSRRQEARNAEEGISSLPRTAATERSIELIWENAPENYREIRFEGMRYTGIKTSTFRFDNLQPDTEYRFKVRDMGGVWLNVSAKTLSRQHMPQ